MPSSRKKPLRTDAEIAASERSDELESTPAKSLHIAPKADDGAAPVSGGSTRRCKKKIDLAGKEPFVDSEVVGAYIGIEAITVTRFAAQGILPAHLLRVTGHRSHWRFLLSEVRAHMLSEKGNKKGGSSH